MSKVNLLELTNDVHQFVKNFEDKYGLFLRVEISGKPSKVINLDILSKVHQSAIALLHIDYPEHDNIKSFSHRCRKIEVMWHSQAFQLLAWNLGYTKSAIARLIDRNHASVINNIEQAQHYLYTDYAQFCRIYYKLFKIAKHYVGTISTNDDGQDNSKSIIPPLRA